MTETTRAIRVHEYGGPDVLQMDEIPLAAPGPGEVRLRHTAIGVNYADIHTRNGRYPLPHLPSCLGSEGAGVVNAVGDGVDFVSVGDRVTYSSGGHALPRGSYCEARTMTADRLIALPDNIDDATAAAMMTKGLTAHYLIHDVYPVGPGDTIAIHAAAGGVGQILCQWANHLGARVIGIVGSEAKEKHAANAGCHHTLVRERDDVVAAVKSLTAGEQHRLSRWLRLKILLSVPRTAMVTDHPLCAREGRARSADGAPKIAPGLLGNAQECPHLRSDVF